MMVPAPGLFSIMTDAPRSFAISCASLRAIKSVPPPGPRRRPGKMQGATMLQAQTERILFSCCVEMACAFACEGLLKNAIADHALRHSAMRRATDGYDAGRACWRWTRATAID